LGYWPSLNYPYYTQAVAYLQQVFSFIFTLTKPLISLTKTGLPNKSVQPMPVGAFSRVRASLARHG
jgi:hypothetical protein